MGENVQQCQFRGKQDHFARGSHLYTATVKTREKKKMQTIRKSTYVYSPYKLNIKFDK